MSFDGIFDLTAGGILLITCFCFFCRVIDKKLFLFDIIISIDSIDSINSIDSIDGNNKTMHTGR